MRNRYEPDFFIYSLAYSRVPKTNQMVDKRVKENILGNIV